jgi:hypothetical protein
LNNFFHITTFVSHSRIYFITIFFHAIFVPTQTQIAASMAADVAKITADAAKQTYAQLKSTPTQVQVILVMVVATLILMIILFST